MTNGKRAETLVSTQDRMRGSLVSKLRTSCRRSMPSFTGISYRNREGKGGGKKKRRQRSVLQPAAHSLQLLELDWLAAAKISGFSAEDCLSQSRKKSSRSLSLPACCVHLLREEESSIAIAARAVLHVNLKSPLLLVPLRKASFLSLFGFQFSFSLSNRLHA